MTFSTLGLMNILVDNVRQEGYKTPSAIQRKAIPAILSGRDIVASAQTGTGKTASFMLPILHRLHDAEAVQANQTKALVLAPTRELAAQIHDKIQIYSANTALRSAVVFGGVQINPQMMALRKGVHILVATPGRLLDLHQKNAIRFNQVQYLVLDEADRMLDMGFIHDIKRIIQHLPSRRQTLLFSATFSPQIRQLVRTFLRNPIDIDVAPRNSTVESIKQCIHPVDKQKKHELLSHLVHQHQWSQALVFTRTKHGANKLVKQLAAMHIHAAAIHGDKSQAQRTKALFNFKSKEIRVLVATDIAARGIDIEALPYVVNYDLPHMPEDYVHRIGRTGRAGSNGLAVSLVSADEIEALWAIEAFIQKTLPRIEVENFEPSHRLPETRIKRPQSSKPKKSPKRH